ncbi:MAG TPA: hypothetical protein VFH16_00245 [Rubrobacter sp.]|nr:hypothetical protein [Rubrobacter sp.]
MTRRLPVSAPGVLGTLILNGFFAALFVGSALLFRYAAREQPPRARGRRQGRRVDPQLRPRESSIAAPIHPSA